MKPSAIRVARRFLARSVQVEVNEKATERARARYKGDIAIGRFLSPIKLYRVFDGEELRRIIDTGEIKGGDYSVAGERAFGSQWGSDRQDVAKWGEMQRSKRLGHELFMAEINGQGRVFSHLSGAGGKMQPGETITLDAEFCATSLGCSLHVGMYDVDNWYVVEPGGKPRKISFGEMEEMVSTVGLKPRDVDLYKGALLDSLPERVRRGLAWKVFKSDFRNRELSPREVVLKQQDLGIRHKDFMPEDKLGRNVLRAMCKDTRVDCGTWGTSISKAQRESKPSRADQINSFALVVCLTAHTAIPYHEAVVWGLDDVAVKWIDVEMDGGRDIRIWQPWGDVGVKFHESGRLTFK